MGKKARVENQKFYGTSSLNPVVVNVKFIQKILLFASNRPRFPVLCSTTCAPWRETVVEFKTGEICWRNLARTTFWDSDTQEEENEVNNYNNNNKSIIQKQLQCLFNQACCGGRARTNSGPISSTPILWVVEQLLPLALPSTEIQNNNHVPIISINATVNVPDFDSFPLDN